MTLETVVGTTAATAVGTKWEWASGDQPAFSPRHADVPRPALELLEHAQRSVVLGWFHRYPARFAVDVVTGMLANVISEGQGRVTSVLDPFCGTAAVVSASRQLGLSAIGVELTTLGATVGRLRLDPPRNPWDAAAFCERLARERPAGLTILDEDLVTWLGEDNARLVEFWKGQIAEIDDPRLRRFAIVALSQSLRPSSRWLSGSVKATMDPTRNPIPLEVSLRRWARQLARDCTTEQDATTTPWHNYSNRRHRGIVLRGDARALPLADASVDAIVTSPPYFVTYDYFDVHRLSYRAFGWPVQRGDQIGARYGHAPTVGDVVMPPAFLDWYRNDFRAEQTVLGRALRVYVANLRTHLAEALRVVVPEGRVAYSLANTVRAGRVFNLVAGFGQLLEEAGFKDVRAEPRVQNGRRILPAGRDIASGRFSSDPANAGVREYVVSGRRP